METRKEDEEAGRLVIWMGCDFGLLEEVLGYRILPGGVGM